MAIDWLALGVSCLFELFFLLNWLGDGGNLATEWRCASQWIGKVNKQFRKSPGMSSARAFDWSRRVANFPSYCASVDTHRGNTMGSKEKKTFFRLAFGTLQTKFNCNKFYTRDVTVTTTRQYCNGVQYTWKMECTGEKMVSTDWKRWLIGHSYVLRK